jgi:hypothetical protein
MVSPSSFAMSWPNAGPFERPPRYPDLALRHSLDGAVAFTGYFIKMFDWGYAANNPNVLVPLAAESCRACRRYQVALARVVLKRERLVGGRITLKSVAIDRHTYRLKADVVVDVAVDEQPVIIKPKSAAPTTAAPEERSHHSLVFLDWRSSVWRVMEVVQR